MGKNAGKKWNELKIEDDSRKKWRAKNAAKNGTNGTMFSMNKGKRRI